MVVTGKVLSGRRKDTAMNMQQRGRAYCGDICLWQERLFAAGTIYLEVLIGRCLGVSMVRKTFPSTVMTKNIRELVAVLTQG